MAIMTKINRRRHTKPCLYFQTNNCPLSADECDFAHVIATPEQYEALKNPQATLRTKPCKFYLGGQCRDGYWCRFKHPANMFATSRESDAGLLDDVPELESDRGTDDDVDVRDLDGAWKAKPEEHPKYRTRPCRNYILGKCIYGDQCSYLHVIPPPKTTMDGVSPRSADAISPSQVLYYPVTPPSHRAPPSTPISMPHSGSDVEVFDLDSSIFRTPIRPRFKHETTPSTTSVFSEESATPATPGINDYAAFARGCVPSLPLSPLSPLSYARGDYMAKARNQLDCLPLSPPLQSPLSVYSPTSSGPVQIVHVPFAVPMYPEVTSPTATSRRLRMSTQTSQPLRSRAFSQPNVAAGMNLQESLPHRAKPCKFFAESRKCQKDDSCDFSHAPSSPSPLGKSGSVAGKELVASKSEKEQKTPFEGRKDQKSPDESKENQPNNFYKINWRVVGGGVKMGTDKTEQRRHSEDAFALYQRRSSLKNPFESMRGRLSSASSTLGPALNLKEGANRVRAVTGSQKPDASSKKGANKALSLVLESYNLSKASIVSKPTSKADSTCPILVVQDNTDERPQKGDMKPEKFLSAPYLDITRAKSSPSSPVTAIQNLPSVIFSAESP